MNLDLLLQCFWTWNQFELALQLQLIIYSLWCNCGRCMHQSLAFQYNIYPWPRLLGQLARETPDRVYHSCIVSLQSGCASAPTHYWGRGAQQFLPVFALFPPPPNNPYPEPLCNTGQQERAEVCGVDLGPGPRLLRSQPWLIIETQGRASPLL